MTDDNGDKITELLHGNAKDYFQINIERLSKI